MKDKRCVDKGSVDTQQTKPNQHEEFSLSYYNIIRETIDKANDGIFRSLKPKAKSKQCSVCSYTATINSDRRFARKTNVWGFRFRFSHHFVTQKFFIWLFLLL
jgi:hypothetical protein